MIDYFTTNCTNYTNGYALDNRMIIRVIRAIRGEKTSIRLII